MCGIIGYVGKEEAAPALLCGIRRLEYRGYDSVGMATQKNGTFTLKKDVGEVDVVNRKHDFLALAGTIGMAHSRWATHGGVTQANAHPHLSQSKTVLAVHNGIIENYEEMKAQLERKGHRFASQTDSEAIPHYIEEKLHEGSSIAEAIRELMHDAAGTFAILLMVAGDNKLYALRRDSPLVIGIGEHETYVASDIYAFSDKTDKAIFLENEEWAVVEENGCKIFDKEGKEINREAMQFTWERAEKEKDGHYPHFMLKEITEEPEAAQRLLFSLETEQREKFQQLASLIKSAHKIMFVAAGTSYHASLLAAYCLNKCGIEAQTLIASEFEHFAFLDGRSLVIALSQSGETMDVIDALKFAKQRGAKIAAIVNVPYSTVQRMADLSLNILAGQEVCVASTKSFVNQVAMLLALAQRFGYQTEIQELPEKIKMLFQLIPQIQQIAHGLSGNRDIYIIGRGLSYPVAREIALKIKEISYIHAEGMMGGELKHGTIALIEQGTPVIGIVHGHDAAIISNLKEVEARGARVITIGPGDAQVTSVQAPLMQLPVPPADDGTFSILATIVGQLLAYYIALKKGLPIDKPRNLAKCVSVR